VAREIFGEVSNPTQRLGSQSRYTVPVSILVHVAIAAGAVIAPLMAADVLPTPRTVIGAFAAQPAPPPPPPPAAASPTARAEKPVPVSSTAAPMDAPSSIEPERPSTSTVTHPDGTEGGLPDGIVGSLGLAPHVPVIPTPDPPKASGPLPVGGRIKEPAKIRHVPPVYPSIAQQARVEGIVIIEAVIGIDGRVKQARVLRSKPLLDDAALDAVRQWLFTPTTLNGVPVPVIMTVTVNFKLN
jgi:periplasmic protein TonB